MSGNPAAPARRRLPAGLLPVLIVFAATLAAYWPVLHAGYVWDDFGFFVTPPPLQSWAGLARIWTDPSATEQYYPLLHSAFWVQHRFWGDGPLGYHLVNVLLHATSACLLGRILRALQWSRPAALFGALLFALHPVAVESVAWIAEQKNTLSAVFYFLAVLSYLKYEAAPAQRGIYWRATALFLCALLCKTVTATLPAALLVLFWWRDGRLRRAQVQPLVLWLALGAGAGLFSGWVERTYIGAQGADFALPLIARTLQAARAVWFYLGKALWPAHLVFIYPRWTIDPRQPAQYVPLLALALAAAALWRLRHRSRAPLAAALLFAGALFPTLGFLNIFAFLYSYVADHWQYLALPIVTATAAGAWDRWLGSRKAFNVLPIWAALTAASVLTVLGVASWRETHAYLDQVSFYRTILSRNPGCWMAENNLGRILASGPGGREEAYALLRAGLRLKPDYAELHINLANLLLDEPDGSSRARAEYETAVTLNPGLAEAHYNLARVLALDPGQVASAVAHYRAALRLKPGFVQAENNLAELLGRLPGHADEAIALYRDLVRRAPRDVAAQNNLGALLMARPGGAAEAIGHYEAALRSDRGRPGLIANLAAAHVARGDELAQSAGGGPAAVAEYRQALALAPDLARAHNNLATQLAQSPAQRPEALWHLEQAVKDDPRYLDAHNNLAAAYAALGRWAEAERELGVVLRLAPGDADAAEHLRQVRIAAGARH